MDGAAIGGQDIAPDGEWTARQARGFLKSGTEEAGGGDAVRESRGAATGGQRYGRELRQVGGESERAVVSFGIESDNLRADAFEPDAEFHDGGTVEKVFCNGRQHPGAPVEQVSFGGLNAADFFAGEGMSAEKLHGGMALSRGHDFRFCAAGVGDQSVRAQMRGDGGERIADDADRLSEKEQIGAAGRFFEGAGAVDGAEGAGAFDGCRGGDTEDFALEAGGAQSEGE